jgi:hypothetical protein
MVSMTPRYEYQYESVSETTGVSVVWMGSVGAWCGDGTLTGCAGDIVIVVVGVVVRGRRGNAERGRWYRDA